MKMNEISNKAVYRTAPATPGLLKRAKTAQTMAHLDS